MEATLSVLGLGDPVLPTWGKLLHDAQNNGALFNGHFYWVLEPAILLVIAGFGFCNARLRARPHIQPTPEGVIDYE